MKYSINSFLVSISVSFIFLLFVCRGTVQAQAIRVAILDFQNISGITKYDGLGKAMSSMLISDIESNVSPKRLQLVERSQIQKILKEQNFQASGNVNKSTAVQAGKILGVKYLLIGDVFILNDQLVINARLTNTETGDILFSKKQEGKMMNWLALKTGIAKELATKLAMPFTEPRIIDATIATAVLTTYANAIDEKDKGNFEKAETLISTAKEFDPAFGYLDDLRDDVDKLKKQVAEQGKKIESLEKSGGRIIGASTYKEYLQNFYSNFTSNEEREKIVIKLVDDFPKQFDSGFTSIHFSYFYNEYGIQYGNDFTFTSFKSIISPLLKQLDISRDKKLYGKYLYLKSLYLLMNSGDFKFESNGNFDKQFYNEFRLIISTIINANTSNDEERMYYQLFLFHTLYAPYKRFNDVHTKVKKDILENFKNIFELLQFNYTDQVTEISEKYNYNDLYYPFEKNNDYFSSIVEIITALSLERSSFKNVTKRLSDYILNHSGLREHILFEQNKENKSDNYQKGVIEEYCANYFTIPSIYNNGLFLYNSNFANKYFIGDPNMVGLNQDFRQQIVNLDSVNRRYKWIYEYTDTQTFESPCDFVKIAPSLVRISDSLALEEILYVLSDNFDKGSRVTIVCNSKNDTIPGIVIGNTLQKNNKVIEIIETPSSRRIDKTNPVLIKIDEIHLPYLIEKGTRERDYQIEYNDYFKKCEEYQKENRVAIPNNIKLFFNYIS